MADKSYFIETEFSEYESEVFTEEQIKDNFISVLRTVDDEDEGIVMVMGASEPIGDYICISSIVFSDHCRVELYDDFNNRVRMLRRTLRSMTPWRHSSSSSTGMCLTLEK